MSASTYDTDGLPLLAPMVVEEYDTLPVDLTTVAFRPNLEDFLDGVSPKTSKWRNPFDRIKIIYVSSDEINDREEEVWVWSVGEDSE